MTRRIAPVAVILTLSLIPFILPLIRGEVFTFRDHSDYFEPMRYYTSSRLAAGDLPLWNPFSGSGERWLANPETAVFYPPAWLMVLLPFATGYVAFLWFHVALAGVGSWFLFRRWVQPPSALLGAVAMMFQGPLLSLLDVSNNLASIAWLPLVVWCALERSEPEPRAPVAIPIVFLALSFLGGEPFLSAIVWLLYGVVLLWRSRLRRAGDLLLTGVGSLILVSPQLVPFVGMLAGSDRARGLGRALAFRDSLDLTDWISTLLSTATLSGSFVAIRASQYFIPTMYLGAFVVFGVLLGLALLHFDSDKRIRGVIIGWLVLFAACAIVAAGAHAGFLFPLLARSGLDVIRYPARLAPVASFALIGIAVTGWDRHQTVPLRIRALASLVVAALLGLGWFLFLPDRPGGVRIVVSAISLLAATVLLTRRTGPLDRKSVLAGVVLFVSIDLIASAGFLFGSAPFVPTVRPYDRIFHDAQKIVRVTREAFDDGSASSVSERRRWLAGYLNLYDGIFDASTAAPVIDRRYLELHDRALWQPRLDLVDFLGVGHVLAERPLHAPGYSLRGRTGEVRIYRNAGAFPPATGWTTWRSTSSGETAFRRILDGGFDARRTLFVTGAPPPVSNTAPVRASIELVQAGEGVVRVRSRSNVPMMVVITQRHARGWNASIDDRPAPVYEADGVFLATHVTSGDHIIVCRYHEPHLGGLVILSALGLIACFIESVSFLRRRRDVVDVEAKVAGC
ncbi:MAG: hypothetical protein WBX15_20505 [Thermoanaerobaculia bacterium]